MKLAITLEDVRKGLLEWVLPGHAAQAERAIRQAALLRMANEADAEVARLCDEIQAALATPGGFGRYNQLRRKCDAAESRSREAWETLNATWKESVP